MEDNGYTVDHANSVDLPLILEPKRLVSFGNPTH